MVRRLVILACCALVLAGCQASKKIPPQALQLSPEDLGKKQLQMRSFDTGDEKMILSASAALLQDLGFNLDESCTDLGLVSSSKNRTAVEAGQVAGKILVAAVLGVNIPVDKEQMIRASLVTKRIGEKGEKVAVRLTLQRVVWNEVNQISKAESVNDAQIYQEFFNKLSQSVFLEAHAI